MITEEEAKETAEIIISTKEFEEVLDREVAYLKEWSKDGKETGLMPMLHVYYRSNFNEPLHQTIVAFADLPNDEERYKAFKGLGAMFYQENNKHTGSPKGHVYYPLAIAMSSEVWMKSGIKELPKGMAVRDYEDKVEAICVFAMTLDNRNGQAFFMTERNDDGTIKPLIEVKHRFTDATARSFLLEEFYRGFMMAMVADGKMPMPEGMKKNDGTRD